MIYLKVVAGKALTTHTKDNLLFGVFCRVTE